MNVITDHYRPTNEHEAALLEFVGGLDYLDGWELVLTREHHMTLARLTWTVEDVHHPGAKTVLVARMAIEVGMLGDYAIPFFLHQLWDRIGDLEAHERLELLTRNGKPIWNPHPEPGKLAFGPHGNLAVVE